MSYLCYLCLLVHSGVQHILYCVFVFLRHVASFMQSLMKKAHFVHNLYEI